MFEDEQQRSGELCPALLRRLSELWQNWQNLLPYAFLSRTHVGRFVRSTCHHHPISSARPERYRIAFSAVWLPLPSVGTLMALLTPSRELLVYPMIKASSLTAAVLRLLIPALSARYYILGCTHVFYCS